MLTLLKVMYSFKLSKYYLCIFILCFNKIV